MSEEDGSEDEREGENHVLMGEPPTREGWASPLSLSAAALSNSLQCDRVAVQ